MTISLQIGEFSVRTLTRAEIVAYLRRRDGSDCFYCGRQLTRTFQLDHVTPRSRGGATDVENFVLACAPCNYEKATYAGWLYVVLRAVGPVPRRLLPSLPPIDAAAWARGDWMRELGPVVVVEGAA